MPLFTLCWPLEMFVVLFTPSLAGAVGLWFPTFSNLMVATAFPLSAVWLDWSWWSKLISTSDGMSQEGEEHIDNVAVVSSVPLICGRSPLLLLRIHFWKEQQPIKIVVTVARLKASFASGWILHLDYVIAYSRLRLQLMLENLHYLPQGGSCLQSSQPIQKNHLAAWKQIYLHWLFSSCKSRTECYTFERYIYSGVNGYCEIFN